MTDENKQRRHLEAEGAIEQKENKVLSCSSPRPSKSYKERSPRKRRSSTILCLILFCLQEEPLSSKQGGCAGRP